MPKTLNSLDLDMCNMMIPKVKEFHGEGAPRAVLISGEGGKAFCAGGDIVSLYHAFK